MDASSLGAVSALAAKNAYCDYALYAGATVNNAAEVAKLARRVAGLKMYLCDTYTTLRLDDMQHWLAVR